MNKYEQIKKELVKDIKEYKLDSKKELVKFFYRNYISDQSKNTDYLMRSDMYETTEDKLNSKKAMKRYIDFAFENRFDMVDLV